MRRSLILALAFSLTGLGPAPLSYCAIISSQLAECATPATRSACDRMDMNDSGTKLAARRLPCCSLENAPVAARQQNIHDAGTVMPAVPVAAFTQFIPPVAGGHPAEFAADPSPPPLRSLLCTFLI